MTVTVEAIKLPVTQEQAALLRMGELEAMACAHPDEARPRAVLWGSEATVLVCCEPCRGIAMLVLDNLIEDQCLGFNHVDAIEYGLVTLLP